MTHVSLSGHEDRITANAITHGQCENADVGNNVAWRT
jgi:hypothetical protein